MDEFAADDPDGDDVETTDNDPDATDEPTVTEQEDDTDGTPSESTDNGSQPASEDDDTPDSTETDSVESDESMVESTRSFSGTVPVATGIASAGSDQHDTNHPTIPMNIDYEPADADELSEDLDEPVVVEQSELESLAEDAEQSEAVQEELEQLTDKIDTEESAEATLSALDEEERDLLESDGDVTVVEASTAEMFDEVSNIYAGELAKYSPFEAEELAEKFSPIDLKERLEDHDEAELAAEIEETDPEPEGGHAEGDELGEGDDPDEPDKEELREEYAQELEEAGWDTQAEKVRSGDLEIEA
jgi:hypothetical protein